MVFEGTFFNGKKWNGKAWEYYYDDRGNYTPVGKLIFEGEYLYGCRKKGKKYFDNKRVEFEGDFLFNMEFNGKKYDYNGNVLYELKNGNAKVKYGTFEGEYINGKWNGKGIEYGYKGYIKYEGEYLNGKRSGKGKEY